MIVTTEIRDVLNDIGEPAKQLVLSYINKEGNISYLTYTIPPSQMYQWKYAKRTDVPDRQYKSWDFKPVVKDPVKFGKDHVYFIVDMDFDYIYVKEVNRNGDIVKLSDLYVNPAYTELLQNYFKQQQERIKDLIIDPISK